MDDEPVKVMFPVEPGESGQPAITCEQLWCLPIGGDRFVVDNIPFYAREISLEDEVEIHLRDGERWFVGVVNPSKNTTVRVFPRRSDAATALTDRLRAFGGHTERMEGSELLAISFPPSADLSAALDYLDAETAVGNVAFEESSVRYR